MQKIANYIRKWSVNIFSFFIVGLVLLNSNEVFSIYGKLEQNLFNVLNEIGFNVIDYKVLILYNILHK